MVDVADRPVELRFEGEAVAAGRVPLDVYTGVLRHLQLAMAWMLQDEWGLAPSGRAVERIRRSPELAIVAIGHGWVRVVAAPRDSTGSDHNAVLERLVGGIVAAGALPEPAREALSRMLDWLTYGVSSLTITPLWEGAPAGRTFVRDDCEVFDTTCDRAPLSAQRTLAGKLLEVDLSRRTAELHSVAAVDRIRFKRRHAYLIKEALGCDVRILGPEVRKNGLIYVHMDQIDVVESAANAASRAAPATNGPPVRRDGNAFDGIDLDDPPLDWWDIDEFLTAARPG